MCVGMEEDEAEDLVVVIPNGAKVWRAAGIKKVCECTSIYENQTEKTK